MFRNEFDSQLLPYLIITIPSQIPDWFDSSITPIEPSIPDAGECSPGVRAAAIHYVSTGEIDAFGLEQSELEEFVAFLGRCSEYRRQRELWSKDCQEIRFWHWRVFYIDRMLTEIKLMLRLREEFEDEDEDEDEYESD